MIQHGKQPRRKHERTWPVHATVPLQNQHEHFRADIDARIAPLVQAIWGRRIRTVFSCEERRPGLAWLRFRSHDDALAFLATALPLCPRIEIVSGPATTGLPDVFFPTDTLAALAEAFASPV